MCMTNGTEYKIVKRNAHCKSVELARGGFTACYGSLLMLYKHYAPHSVWHRKPIVNGVSVAFSVGKTTYKIR